MKPRLSLVLALASAALAPACVKRSAPADSSDAAPSAAPSAALLDEVPRPSPGASVTSVSGVVVENLSVPSYSYLNLDTESGRVWAAVPRSDVAVGQRVTVKNAVLMSAYRSSALKRDFDKVYFGTLAGAPAGSANPHATVSAAPTPSAPPAKVSRATGPDAKTVEELNTSPKALDGKSVSVRGVVVKLNRGIMGKTWLHLADGTGSAGDKTHDLLVTTELAALPNVGDTVTVRGTVATDKDFGSGYKYAVLVEARSIEADAPKR